MWMILEADIVQGPPQPFRISGASHDTLHSGSRVSAIPPTLSMWVSFRDSEMNATVCGCLCCGGKLFVS